MLMPRRLKGLSFSPVNPPLPPSIVKMTSTVLITGASGLLGRQVFNTFQHSGVLVVGQGFSRATPPTILKADLEKAEEIKGILDNVK